MKRYGLFLCLAIMMANIVSAQALKKYEGGMKPTPDIIALGKIFDYYFDDCMGSYQYYENDEGGRIKHGTYKISRKNVFDNIIEISGEYNNGEKSGKWTINNYSEYSMLGIKTKLLNRSLIVNYKNDELNGVFEYIDYDYDNNKYELSRKTDIKGTLENGIICGKLTITDQRLKKENVNFNCPETQKFQGTIDADGLPTGIWTLSNTGVVNMNQRRLYRKGVLVAADEYDDSTGEINMIFASMDNIKKMPNMDEIKDSLIYGSHVIVYRGQVAMEKDNDSRDLFSSISSMGENSYGKKTLAAIIRWDIEKIAPTIADQFTKWDKYYSQTYARKYIKNENKKLEQRLRQMAEDEERNRQDSIARAESMRRYNIIDANNNLSGELYQYMLTQPVKNIKKSYVEGNEIVFQTKTDVFRGIFKKENVKNSMGEMYNGAYKVLSNESGDIYLLKFSHVVMMFDTAYPVEDVYLIDKRNGSAVVYKLTESALKNLPLKW